jgi:hypothetical protein
MTEQARARNFTVIDEAGLSYDAAHAVYRYSVVLASNTTLVRPPASRISRSRPTRGGWFEAAHGGTLFLDEIDDLPVAMQVRCFATLAMM